MPEVQEMKALSLFTGMGVELQEIQRQPSLQRCENIRSIEDLLSRSDMPEPLLRGMDDELPDWKQQLKAIGNGQDPIVMTTSWHLLHETA